MRQTHAHKHTHTLLKRAPSLLVFSCLFYSPLNDFALSSGSVAIEIIDSGSVSQKTNTYEALSPHQVPLHPRFLILCVGIGKFTSHHSAVFVSFTKFREADEENPFFKYNYLSNGLVAGKDL